MVTGVNLSKKWLDGPKTLKSLPMPGDRYRHSSSTVNVMVKPHDRLVPVS